MLEVHYGEKWCFIKDQTRDSLHPGCRTVELRHPSTHDYSHNVFGLIFIPHDVLYVYPDQLALYEYITWCVGEGLRVSGAVGLRYSSTRGYPTNVVGLIFNPHDVLYCLVWVYCMMCWGRVKSPHIVISPQPGLLNDQPLKAWQWNIENPLCRRIVIYKGSNPDQPAFQVGGGGLWGSVTPAPEVILTACFPGGELWDSTTPAPEVILPMLLALYSIFTMYCIALYECIAWCVGEGLRGPIL